jgi:hypothetical protein
MRRSVVSLLGLSGESASCHGYPRSCEFSKVTSQAMALGLIGDAWRTLVGSRDPYRPSASMIPAPGAVSSRGRPTCINVCQIVERGSNP